MSTESIVTELFYVVLGIPTLTVAAIAIPIAGIALLIYSRKITVLRQELRYLLLISILFAFAQFTWYDSITRIGAGEVALIDIPLGTVFIIVLAWIFLRERLNITQIIGALMVMIGVIVSINIGIGVFGIGEIEAIMTALSTAVYTILVVRLLNKHDTIQVTGFVLLFSGAILQLQWLVNPTTNLQHPLLFITPFIALSVVMLQFISYKKVGASLTSIITSTTIILTVVLQVILVQFSIPVVLPQNLILALIGGLVSVVGITTIFLNEKNNVKKCTM